MLSLSPLNCMSAKINFFNPPSPQRAFKIADLPTPANLLHKIAKSAKYVPVN